MTRERVLAFRLARHHLGERAPDAATAASPGLQDTPPGSAGAALAARADAGPEALDELITVPSLRGAATAVAPADLAMFTAGLEPSDEEEARHLTGNAWKSLDGVGALQALDIASEAVRDVLADGPLAKTDFHRALTGSPRQIFARPAPLGVGRASLSLPWSVAMRSGRSDRRTTGAARLALERSEGMAALRR